MERELCVFNEVYSGWISLQWAESVRVCSVSLSDRVFPESVS